MLAVRGNMERDTQRHLALGPQGLNGAKIFREHAAAREVVDGRHAEAIEFAEIFAGAGNLIGKAWPRNFCGEEIERTIDAGEDARQVAAGILLGLAARDFSVRCELHELDAGWRDPGRVIETLHINRSVGRRGDELLDGWTAFLRKLQFGPAAADLDPGARRLGARRLANDIKALGKGRHANPARFDRI